MLKWVFDPTGVFSGLTSISKYEPKNSASNVW